MTQKQAGFIAPDIDADSQTWWDALDSGDLIVQQCGTCKHFSFPLTPTCPSCAATNLVDVVTAGSGVVYSWVRVCKALDRAFDGDVPYVVVAVDLDEGPRVFGRYLGDEDRDLIGQRVEKSIYRVQEHAVLGFAPASR